MWLKKKNSSKETDAPEKLRYSRYYEHDGILRAYANRAMVLAFLCIPITMLAISFAVSCSLAASHCHSCGRERPGDGSRSWKTGHFCDAGSRLGAN